MKHLIVNMKSLLVSKSIQLGKGEEHKIVSSKDKMKFDSNLAFVYLYITYLRKKESVKALSPVPLYLRRDHFQSIMAAISLPAQKSYMKFHF